MGAGVYCTFASQSSTVMELQTYVALPERILTLEPSSGVMMVGSCFASHIGKKLTESLPRKAVTINPRGVMYNPLSILTCLNRFVWGEGFTDDTSFIAPDGLWHDWRFDTTVTAESPEALEERIEKIEAETAIAFDRMNVLFITFSTDHAYLLKDRIGDETDRVVTNCHKMTPATFEEVTLDGELLYKEWSRLLDELEDSRPWLKIVFTLSPYRYAKYGMHENALSKARLLLLIERLTHHRPKTYYFPAYEIILDELRDYRFYKEDMLHPSDQAVDYVWERFRDWAFSDELSDFSADRGRLLRRHAHRPRHEESEEHRAFLLQTKEMEERFLEKWGMTWD